MAKLEGQIKELQEMCSRMGVTYEELADEAGINRETMRKYFKGYQPIPDDKLGFLKMVEERRRLRGPLIREEGVPYRITTIALDLLPDAIIDQIFKTLATKLTETVEPERGRIMQALLAVTQDLQRRGSKPSSISTSEDEAILDAAERAADSEREGSLPKPAADEPSAQRRGPSTGASTASKGGHAVAKKAQG